MPYSEKERKLMRGLIKQYGAKKAEQIYHAMANEYEKHPGIFSEKTIKKVQARRKKSKK